MRIATISMTIFLATLVMTALDAAAQNTIYRWVDENGVVHYADQPNDKAGSEVIPMIDEGADNIQEGAKAETAAPRQQSPSIAQQRRDARAEKRREAAEKQAAIDEGCMQRKQLVASLEPSPRVIVENEDGTVSRMDDNERMEILAEAQAYIAENCGK